MNIVTSLTLATHTVSRENRGLINILTCVCVCVFFSQYYEEMGKPTPKVEVMKYLKNKQYTDAKDFAGEYESVVIIAKGQSTNP